MNTQKPTYDELAQKIARLENQLANNFLQNNEDTYIKFEDFNKIIMCSGNGAMIGDKNGMIISWNENLEKILGIKAEDAIGKYIWDVQYQVTPLKNRKEEYRLFLKNSLFEILERKTSWYMNFHEQELIGANEETIIIEDSSFLINSNTGSYFVGLFRDITDSKKAEKALKEREERYKSLLNNLEAGILVYDKSIQLINCNQRTKELLGFEDLFDDLQVSFKKYIQISDENEQVIDFENVFLKNILIEKQSVKNKQLKFINTFKSISIWAEVNISIQNDEHGEVGEILISFLDITERKHTKEALKIKNIALDSSIQAIGITDLNGNLTHVNDALVKLWGYEHISELIGKSALDFWIDEEDMKKIIQESYESGFCSGEKFAKLKNGERFPAAFNISVIRDEKNKILGLVGSFEDLTERRKVESELINSENLYRSILNASPDTIAITDLNGSIEIISPIAKTIYGFNSELDFIGKSIIDFLIPEHKDKAMKNISAMFDNVFNGAEEYIGIKKNGERFEVEANAEFIKDQIGKPSKIVFVIRDITERKKAELELLKSKKQYDRLVSKIPVGIYIIRSKPDASFQFEYVSPILAKILNENVENILLNPNIAFRQIHPEEKDNFIKLNYESLHKMEPFDWKGRAILNKELKWLHLSSVPEVQENGDILWHGILTDITEVTEAEIKIRKVALHYHSILEKAPDGIVLLNEQGKFKFLSESAKKIFGYDNELEVINLALVQFIHPEDLAMVLDNLTKIASEPVFVPTIQYRFLNKQLEYIWIESTITNLLADTNVESIVINFRDISERKEYEEEINIKNFELSKLNADKDKFFSVISHDLRGPINGFLGLTEILTEDLNTMSMDEIKIISINMRNSASNLFRLLENLLQWAKIQQGLIPFHPEIQKLLPLVNDSIQLSFEAAQKKGIVIKNEIKADMMVFADFNILQTVFRNLVSNAVKFTSKGGLIEIKAQKNDIELFVTISDTGIGIPASMLNSLFAIDSKKNRKGTDGEPSTGLGLILSKEFIEKHHGKIWVESTENKGTTFYFTLPTN